MTKRIYLDCDGVLADFDAWFIELFDERPEIYEAKHGAKKFWGDIRDADRDFFLNLPLMEDAKFLHDFCDPYRPIILTGCPRGGWSEMQKLKWAARHFPGTPMITCSARDKRLYCRPGDILIDDRVKHAQLWKDAGGVFIEHRRAWETIDVLNDLGY